MGAPILNGLLFGCLYQGPRFLETPVGPIGNQTAEAGCGPKGPIPITRASTLSQRLQDLKEGT